MWSMYFLIALVLPLVLAGLAGLLASRVRMARDMCAPFECGFDPKHSARSAFSLRFFLLAVIFLVFDVEVVLLFPVPLILGVVNQAYAMVVLSLFLGVLLVGLFFEWREGALEWVK